MLKKYFYMCKVDTKLLRIYRTKLETDNLSTKNGHFMEPFSRYKDDWPDTMIWVDNCIMANDHG